jgi:nitrite reductase (cytochrome c-552)
MPPIEPSSRWLPVSVGYLVAVVLTAGVTLLVVALLMNIFERRYEARSPHVRVVEVTENTIDPAVWGRNWPHSFDSFSRTADHARTRYGGSSAVPEQKLDHFPWLRTMYSGFAFSLDYREAQDHTFMLLDQELSERVLQREQHGACLHCHSSVLPLYRFVGEGDVMEGFRQVNAMPYNKARNLTNDDGDPLVTHPATCVDCHDPETMAVRITRPAFLVGIASYMENMQGAKDYDVNRDASRHELRTFVCAQCHVEYYTSADDKQLTYPWARGLSVDQEERYYDELGFSDWTHDLTGAPMLKAQHPEFELHSQGPHAQAGVTCADCHMPYERQGAMKVSSHHVRSPLLDLSASCMTCHGGSESSMLDRVHQIQERHVALTHRAAEALMDMINAIVAARENGATDQELEDALRYHRRAQWRLDWIFSENSHGFHAPQESARVLADSIDFSRRGPVVAPRPAQTPRAPSAP